MSLADYSALKASIADWLHRDDLTAVIPDFITLAEERMARDLAECPMLWAIDSTLTATPATRTLALPTNFMAMRELKYSGSYAGRDLAVITYDAMIADSALLTAASGAPRYAAVFNGTTTGAPTLLLWPTPNLAYTFELHYSTGVPALTVGNPVNFLLKRFPSAYLYGALVESAPYLGQDARTAVWEAKYRAAIDAIMSLDWGATPMLRTEVAELMGARGGYDIRQG